MSDADVTWEQMWAEEGLDRARSISEEQQDATSSAWLKGGVKQSESTSQLRHHDVTRDSGVTGRKGLSVKGSSSPGEKALDRAEAQPYYEFYPDEQEFHNTMDTAPALHLTVPSLIPTRKMHTQDNEEGAPEIDWQAPSSVVASEPVPLSQAQQRGREWEKTWADEIHRKPPRIHDQQ